MQNESNIHFQINNKVCEITIYSDKAIFFAKDLIRGINPFNKRKKYKIPIKNIKKVSYTAIKAGFLPGTMKYSSKILIIGTKKRCYAFKIRVEKNTQGNPLNYSEEEMVNSIKKIIIELQNKEHSNQNSSYIIPNLSWKIEKWTTFVFIVLGFFFLGLWILDFSKLAALQIAAVFCIFGFSLLSWLSLQGQLTQAIFDE